MKEQKYDYGMIGLGTMGRNLVYNMSDHGFTVIGFDKNNSQVETLNNEAPNDKVFATTNLEEFLQALKSPKVIMMLVPAGKIVNDVINDLKPFLSEDDLLIDCGNSHFTDTNIRYEELKKSSIHFMGIGISGGELGARHGPSIMPGGPKEVYERVDKMLAAISAKVNNEPCVTWLGPGSSGHYVKMVHNGIEYGMMQLISEAYHLMKKVVGMSNEEIHKTFLKWNEGDLQSYLIEITADIFAQKDEFSDSLIIDKILDSAKQKGTGAWTSEDAMKLQVPIPVIDIAVSMRDLSGFLDDRKAGLQYLKSPETKFTGDKEDLLKNLEQALYFSFITVYAQGMSLLHVASKYYNYDLKLEDIATIWRGGCIIRAELLKDIRTVYTQQADLSNLMMSDIFSKNLIESQKGIRNTIQTGVSSGIPIPALMGSLAYFDSFRSDWLPANLIQAQRDNFGAHTYARTDREGIFHTIWNQKE
jgi:6-phosphogluconate dehydrogenase